MIVVAAPNGALTVKLIDCESVCLFGTSLERVPVRPRFRSLIKTASAERHEARAWERA